MNMYKHKNLIYIFLTFFFFNRRALSDAGADVEGADPSSGIGGVRTFRYGGRLAYTQVLFPLFKKIIN